MTKCAARWSIRSLLAVRFTGRHAAEAGVGIATLAVALVILTGRCGAQGQAATDSVAATAASRKSVAIVIGSSNRCHPLVGPALRALPSGSVIVGRRRPRRGNGT